MIIRMWRLPDETSGDIFPLCFMSMLIHPRAITLACNIFTQEDYYRKKGWCFTVDARSAATRLHGHACGGPVYINVPANSPIGTALQRHGHSPVHPHGRFMRTRWPTAQKTTCSSVLAYNAAADSSVCSRGRLARD